MNPTILYDSCKKWLKRKLYPSPSSIPEYLHSLGVESLWHYPARQVIDILTDYQEYLTAEKEQGADDDSLFQRFGSPDTVIKELLSENPSGKHDVYRALILWGALFIFSFWEAIYLDNLPPDFQCLGFLALFGLIRGRESLAVERIFPGRQFHTGRTVLMHMLIAAMTAAIESFTWYAFTCARPFPPKIFHIFTGSLFSAAFSLFSLSFLLITGIMLAKSVSCSIRYFPVAIHAAGGAVCTIKTSFILSRLDLSAGGMYELYSSLLCYGTALMLSLASSLCFTALQRPESSAGQYKKGGV